MPFASEAAPSVRLFFMFSADLGPEESMPQSRVRFVGSRELHRDLPKVLEALENPGARFVLTIHSKPKAVLIGAEEFLEIMRNPSTEDRLLPCSLVRSSRASNPAAQPTPEIDQRREPWSRFKTDPVFDLSLTPPKRRGCPVSPTGHKGQRFWSSFLVLATALLPLRLLH